jgi:hypothetical protein
MARPLNDEKFGIRKVLPGTNEENNKMTKPEEFWNWFVQHGPELFAFDPDQESVRERIFDQLATELQ